MDSSGLTRRRFLQHFAAGAAAPLLASAVGPRPYAHAATAGQGERPNIVFILADDMGWGDPQCYNPESRVPTPHMDKLASQGMKFTDAHSPGVVCTPSRYGFLTGSYYWRLNLGRAGTDGWSANIVDTRRVTAASLLQSRGYRTVCIGKWHLGMGTEEPVDYFKPQYPNPTSFGFDYYFGIPASLDMAPYLYMENERAVEKPTEEIEGTPFRTAEFYRGGPIAPDFKHEDVLPELTRKCVDIIEKHAAAETNQPLFLYYPMNAPHTPWLPVEEAQGKSEAGKYGDFVWQVDDSIGAVLDALDRAGMADNTLVIVSSDNGGLQSWLPDEYQEHRVNGHFSGEKGGVMEGGHRVPFIARWPGRIEPGSTSDALVCLSDLPPTFASITGATLPERDHLHNLPIAEDASDIKDVLLGNRANSDRENHIVQSVNEIYAIRKGDWKLIDGLGHGGFGWDAEEHQPEPGGPEGQLYNLAEDPSETNNLWMEYPEKVEELQQDLRDFQAEYM